MGILDFLSHDAGQQRRAWLDKKAVGLLDALQYYAGPGMDTRQIGGLLGMLNPVQDVGEAMGNARDGNYTGAAINTASALAPVGAWKLAGSPMDEVTNVLADTMTGIGMKAQGAADAGRGFVADEFGGVGPSGIRAYHGSPHDFDRFDMSKIGTGEGAQAYGHGLYFAENEGVARGYRDALTPPPPTDDAIGQAYALVQDMGGNKRLAAETLRKTVDRGSSRYEIAQRMADAIESGATDKYVPPSGRMYEVRINANPDDFLDWDAPLSEQPANVQDIARNMDLSGLSSRQRGKIQKWMDGTANELEIPTGNELHSMLTDFGTDGQRNAALTQRLASDGIPGIKYLDQGSRGAGDGTRNYVVFDDRLIEIVRKYGIAGAAAMLGVSVSDVQAAMGQQQWQ